MNKNINILQLFFPILILVSTLPVSSTFSQEGAKKNKNHLARILEFDPRIFATLNINNLWAWERKDGKSNHSPSNVDGVYFPQNTSHVIFQDGIVWGARAYVDEDLTIPAPFDQPIRVMGTTYGTGCRSGWIEGLGASAVQANEDDPRARIYRIRRGWKEMSEDAIKQDVANCYEISVSDVTSDQIKIVLDDYQWCWDNWPVSLGAPFIDRNGNGVYDPPPPDFEVNELIELGYDEPGVAGANPNLPADMVIWYVYNDLFRSLRFASEPSGMEVQSTIWGYARTDAMNDLYFRKIKLINKGGVEIDTNGTKGTFYLDSMYVAQWSDPDIGEAGDDLIGCDTLLNLGFAYNSNASDNQYINFNLPPPSVGYKILQGPIVPSPGDLAVIDFKYKQDYKNFGMTSFAYLVPSSPYVDPGPPTYITGALRWYKMMRGFAPYDDRDIHYKFPPGVKPGPFPFAGDPIVGTGYIDGLSEKSVHMDNFLDMYSFAPGDRRMLCASGPFQLAPGETQEVVIGIVCGLGADRLSSISVMKFNSRVAQKYYNSFLSLPDVNVFHQTIYPNNKETEFIVRANLRNFSDINNSQLVLTPQFGSEQEITLQLFDDGMHSDNQAGDFIWGNSVTQANRKYPLEGKLIIQKTSGQDTIPVLKNVKLRPSPKLINWKIVWENGRQDLRINSYEKVHLKFDILNTDELNALDHTKFECFTQKGNRSVVNFSETVLPGEMVTSEDLFFEIDGPSTGDTVTVKYIKYYNYFSEPGSKKFSVFPLLPPQTWGDTLAVKSEKGGENKIVPIVADPTQLTGHTYRINFYKKDDQLFWSLTDTTTNEIKYEHGYTSNLPYFQHPIIDGIQFRVMSNDSTIESFELVASEFGPLDLPIAAASQWRGYPVPSGGHWNGPAVHPSWFITTHKNGDNDYKTFEDFMSQSFVANGIKALIPHDFEIRFTASGGKVFDYWGMEKMVDVPFELWDVGEDPDDQSDDYRLFAYMLDIDRNSEFNLMYDASDPSGEPGWADHGVSSGDNDPYTDVLYWMSPTDNSPGTQGYDKLIKAIESDPSLRPNWDAKPGDFAGDYDAWSCFANLVLVEWNGGSVTTASSPLDYSQAMPAQGSIFRIVTSKSNLPGGVFYVDSPNPTFDYLPNTSFLYQNYPNPFNPMTQIRFHIAQPANVKLDIFNILGQKVKTLIDKKMTPGERSIFWDGRSEAGVKLGSGVYFFRLIVGDYLKTRKMTLLK